LGGKKGVSWKREGAYGGGGGKKPPFLRKICRKDGKNRRRFFGGHLTCQKKGGVAFVNLAVLKG